MGYGLSIFFKNKCVYCRKAFLSFVFLLVTSQIFSQADSSEYDTSTVFIGDSITENWIAFDPDFFLNNNYINRGIGGQTTSQMLERFTEDVVMMNPKAVVILGGINDIWSKYEEFDIEKTKANLSEMAKIADRNGIEVILCSILPVYEFPSKESMKPIHHIIQLNEWIENYTNYNHFIFVDYYSGMVDKKKGLKKELSDDGIHPNKKGYNLMRIKIHVAIETMFDKE